MPPAGGRRAERKIASKAGPHAAARTPLAFLNNLHCYFVMVFSPYPGVSRISRRLARGVHPYRFLNSCIRCLLLVHPCFSYISFMEMIDVVIISSYPASLFSCGFAREHWKRCVRYKHKITGNDETHVFY